MEYNQQAFFGAWMKWQIDSQNQSLFDTKKAKRKRLNKYLDVLGINEYPLMDETGRAEATNIWQSFAEEFINISLKDKGFASQFFGMVSLKDSEVVYKMANIIIRTCSTYPEKIEMSEVVTPFYDVMKTALIKIVPEAKSYF